MKLWQLMIAVQMSVDPIGETVICSVLNDEMSIMTPALFRNHAHIQSNLIKLLISKPRIFILNASANKRINHYWAWR